jgi:hypothetical protein
MRYAYKHLINNEYNLFHMKSVHVANISEALYLDWGTRWRSWFRHYATSRRVAGSIPDGVTGIFQ